jgi:hypothetical protein
MPGPAYGFIPISLIITKADARIQDGTMFVMSGTRQSWEKEFHLVMLPFTDFNFLKL